MLTYINFNLDFISSFVTFFRGFFPCFFSVTFFRGFFPWLFSPGFDRHNPNYACFLDSDYITPNNLVRDLGITYDSNLGFKHFVNSAVSRAYQRMNLNFRAFCSRNLYAFHNRQIDCWNSLPSFVVESPSVSSFKSRLNSIDLSRHCSGRVLVCMWPSLPSPTPFEFFIINEC